jgi:hypothetical protein
MYLNICRVVDETQQKKESFFLPFIKEAISAPWMMHLFLFFFSRNVLKFAINVGGWKQNTHDA